jgi:5-hydroxyisourate hydrolase
MRLSVQVADCVFGIAASGLGIRLSRHANGDWHTVAAGKTDSDGSLSEWQGADLPAGTYRIEADLDGYYTDLGIVPFNPRLIVEFRVMDTTSDLLIPMLITGNSHLAYRRAQSP